MTPLTNEEPPHGFGIAHDHAAQRCVPSPASDLGSAISRVHRGLSLAGLIRGNHAWSFHWDRRRSVHYAIVERCLELNGDPTLRRRFEAHRVQAGFYYCRLCLLGARQSLDESAATSTFLRPISPSDGRRILGLSDVPCVTRAPNTCLARGHDNRAMSQRADRSLDGRRLLRTLG